MTGEKISQKQGLSKGESDLPKTMQLICRNSGPQPSRIVKFKTGRSQLLLVQKVSTLDCKQLPRLPCNLGKCRTSGRKSANGYWALWA